MDKGVRFKTGLYNNIIIPSGDKLIACDKDKQLLFEKHLWDEC